MSTNEKINNIHPSLLAKLRALYSIFFDQWQQVPLYQFPTYSNYQDPNSYSSKQSNKSKLKIILDDDDGSVDDSGGGGGTIKGLRVEKGLPKVK